MGSTGSGSFTDYSGAINGGPYGQGGAGGASGVDKCKQAFSCILEEVAQCDYYEQSSTVPEPRSELRIVFDKRMFAVDSNGTKIGALPTSFNYLAACLVDGVSYIGVVRSSTVTPVPTVESDFSPQ